MVSGVWWICSHPVRGGYKEKCCLSVLRRGGSGEMWDLLKNLLVQVDGDHVKHCDRQLIDLFGAKGFGPETDFPQGTVFQKFLIFTLTSQNINFGHKCCWVWTQYTNTWWLFLSHALNNMQLQVCGTCSLKPTSTTYHVCSAHDIIYLNKVGKFQMSVNKILMLGMSPQMLKPVYFLLNSSVKTYG